MGRKILIGQVTTQDKGVGVQWHEDEETGAVTMSTQGSLGIGSESHSAEHAAMGKITAITYSSGIVQSFVEDGVTWTISYNGDGTVNTLSNGTVTKTATYNGDGTIATFQ